MKTAADYFTATMPEPWQVLGLRLRPFSLGHYKLLRRFNCAFVQDDAVNCERGDVVLGVLICSMKPAEFLALMESENFIETVKEWGQKCGLFDLAEKAALFKEYIEAHSVVPRYWEKENHGSDSGAHWAQCVEVALRSKLGWTAEEIDEQPLSKAFADYFKYAESEGAIQLMSEREIAFIEASKRQKEETCGV